MTRRRAGLVLAPGASATRNHPSLVAIEEAVVALGKGVEVERIDLPKGKAERAVPAFESAANALVTKISAAAVFLGGRSFGGRVGSMAVAAGGVPKAAGVVLVSYPLHAPGKPDQLRTEHFPSIAVPCLFVSGTRDSFGKPEELEMATKAIGAPVEHVWIDGGDHGLRGKDPAVAAAVAGWLGRLLPVALS
jgi:predicted alpha/beta-hydrolase family hydrolase